MQEELLKNAMEHTLRNALQMAITPDVLEE